MLVSLLPRQSMLYIGLCKETTRNEFEEAQASSQDLSKTCSQPHHMSRREIGAFHSKIYMEPWKCEEVLKHIINLQKNKG